ncbi:MAG: hypothetical protein QXV62_03880, partial [Nitrososphaerota archaeon]
MSLLSLDNLISLLILAVLIYETWLTHKMVRSRSGDGADIAVKVNSRTGHEYPATIHSVAVRRDLVGDKPIAIP